MRALTRDDLPWLIDLRTAPEVSRFMGGSELQNAVLLDKRIDRYIDSGEKYGFGVSAMMLKSTGEMIGTAGLIHLEDSDDVEVGYAIKQDHWRRGLGYEAAMGWLKFGFEDRGLKRIVAIANPANTGSRRIMEKCGMKYDHTAIYYGNECVFYYITANDFLTKDPK